MMLGRDSTGEYQGVKIKKMEAVFCEDLLLNDKVTRRDSSEMSTYTQETDDDDDGGKVLNIMAGFL